MFGLVLKRTHREVLRLWGEEERAWRANEAALHKLLVEKDTLINSTERKKVLDDLESALNLIQAYQRALSIISAADPNIIRANALLEKWGKQGDPMGRIPESYGQITPVVPQGRVLARGKASSVTVTETNEERGEFVFNPANPKSRLEQEKEFWDDEAYGSTTVRIEAEPIDKGDDKEPGYTRARIRFVDMDAEEPADLVAAKATTAEYDMEADYHRRTPYEDPATDPVDPGPHQQ